MDLIDYYDKHWTELPEGDVDWDRLQMIVSREFEALTMRRLASELGVSAMAPYRHVGSKDELLNAMRFEADADGLDHVTIALPRDWSRSRSPDRPFSMKPFPERRTCERRAATPLPALPRMTFRSRTRVESTA